MGVPLVDVTRGTRVESTHAVAACVCDADGVVRFAYGATDVPVYLRSAAKPFIASAVVASGAVERFGFEEREIALMAASHNGEPAHVAGVASMLTKIGAQESDLQCGIQQLGHTQLQHNCSGKHAGILALARMLDAPLTGYLALEHPAQQAILAYCERVFDDRFTPDRLAVDGCGIPVFATSLASAARGLARFARDDTPAASRVRRAMLAQPWYVAGSRRFDTDLMVAGTGTLVVKGGAEGVGTVASLACGLGVALKVVDGARRAVAPAVLAVLEHLELLDAATSAALAGYATAPVHNVAGHVVGRIAARKISVLSGGNPHSTT